MTDNQILLAQTCNDIDSLIRDCLKIQERLFNQAITGIDNIAVASCMGHIGHASSILNKGYRDITKS